MQVDIIETMPEFARLEDNWNAVYDADPDAQLFLSWKWLSGWLGQIAGPWFVLAARSSDRAGAPYVAFFPLRIQTRMENGRIHNELNMAGNFTADYTGLLCMPGAEAQAIAAFARYVKKELNWARLNLENIRVSESRARILLAHFPKANFKTSEISRIGKVDNIDNNCCPYAALPADWDSYLATLSANTRQKIRRLLRLVDVTGEYHITTATPETIDRNLNTLLQFWETKWRPRKGDLVHTLSRANRLMLTRSFRSGLLFLPTLWKEDRPIAALATLIDQRKRAFLFYMTGRDESFDGAPSGVMLHAHSIRHAIANGFTEYDFLRGNEPYKYSFGVKERRIRVVAIGTKNGLNLGGRIDPRSILDVLKEATQLHQTGKLVEAERGYRQILDVEPRHADALYRFGQLLADKSDHVEARRKFRTLTEIRPEIYKPWLALAQSCEALGHHVEAAQARLEVIRLRPDLPGAFDSLASLLAKLGLTEEVSKALKTVLDQATGHAGQVSVLNGRGSVTSPQP